MRLLHEVARLRPDMSAEIHSLVLEAAQCLHPAPPAAFASQVRVPLRALPRAFCCAACARARLHADADAAAAVWRSCGTR